MGPLIPLFWTSGDIYPGFQSQCRSPCLCAILPRYNRILRFTSSVTPADLLVASMAAEPFQSTYLWTSIDGVWVCDLSCCCLTAWDKIDILLTDHILAWLFFKNVLPHFTQHIFFVIFNYFSLCYSKFFLALLHSAYISSIHLSKSWTTFLSHLHIFIILEISIYYHICKVNIRNNAYFRW